MPARPPDPGDDDGYTMAELVRAVHRIEAGLAGLAGQYVDRELYKVDRANDHDRMTRIETASKEQKQKVSTWVKTFVTFVLTSVAGVIAALANAHK